MPAHPRASAETRASFLAGAAVLAAAIASLLVIAARDATLARLLALQLTTHTFVGRETAIATGLATGLPPLAVAAAAGAHDLLTLLLGYALADALARGALKLPWRPRHDISAQRAAFAHRTERAGVAALAIAIWVPFLPGGGLIAALVARAAGYRERVFLPALAASSLLADLAVATLAAPLVARARWLPLVVLAVVLVGAGARWLVTRRARAIRSARAR